ncbi:hypothetical protein [Priestia megaterium]|uniref:hypothetical protein n=1 Tax=Priestia megaterium TaxID=1404 RepID=UPI000D518470|nr:hypothetical protein [Priestia megaterium]PVE64460.1 hypothetical protein DC428_23485 [Priestia megaterium]PVE79874.1 hypothetical protein DC421_24135 [Priestia megaterium]PVE83781.1 hypothetical protein DC426_20240 [Priestia megaterium]PVE99541.1 hypothetical protein DC433_13010 [Priestia megaterium]
MNNSRLKNGIIRFKNRMKDLWYIHVLFLFLMIISLIISMCYEKFDLQSAIVNIISLCVTVYILDFLYSEEARKSSANKRYLIDGAFGDIVRRLEYILYDILIDNEKFYRIDNEIIHSSAIQYLSEEDKVKCIKENEINVMERIFDYNENELKEKFQRSDFWVEKITVSGLFYHKEKTISRSDYLNNLISKTSKDIESHLSKYSSFMLYEDFKIIFQLTESLNDYYLQNGMDYKNTNQEMTAHSLVGLISTLKNAKHIHRKWL